MHSDLLRWLRGLKLALASLLPAAVLLGCASRTPRANVIQGSVGEPPVKGAAIILCDATTGIPLNKSGRPFTETNNLDIWFVYSDAAGRFSFTNLPAGAYRLMAQTPIDDRTWRQSDHLELFQLLGVAENVRVPSDRAGHLRLAPPGKGTVTFDQQMPNGDTYLLLSTRPTTGDPILGFLGWNEDFLAHLLGVARIPQRQRLTLTGLPSRGVHVALFANDSAPGFGAADFASLPATPQKISIVAGWSDAQHEPPPRIKHVMDVLAQYGTSGQQLLKFDPRQARLGPKGFGAMVAELKLAVGPLDRTIPLPNGETATAAEVFATIGYRSLQESDAQRGRPPSRP